MKADVKKMYEATPISTFCHGIKKKSHKIPNITDDLQDNAFNLIVQSNLVIK